MDRYCSILPSNGMSESGGLDKKTYVNFINLYHVKRTKDRFTLRFCSLFLLPKQSELPKHLMFFVQDLVTQISFVRKRSAHVFFTKNLYFIW